MSAPGLDNLGRLIAAERNSVTAIDGVKRLEAQVAFLVERVQRLEGEVVASQQALQQVRMMAAAKIGSGPTAGG